jgi:hypothetical protein
VVRYRDGHDVRNRIGITPILTDSNQSSGVDDGIMAPKGGPLKSGSEPRSRPKGSD